MASEVPWALCWLRYNNPVIIGTRMTPPPIPKNPASVPAPAPAAKYQTAFFCITAYLGMIAQPLYQVNEAIQEVLLGCGWQRFRGKKAAD